MRANDVQPTGPVRHGAYLCLRVPAGAGARGAVAAAPVAALADRLGLRNEFEPGTGQGDPPKAIAFLRRVGVAAADLADDGLRDAEVIVHVAAATPEPVAEFTAEFGAELARVLGPAVSPRVLAGVVRPMRYTSSSMFDFAYAHRVLPQPGAVMPNAFLVPLRKTAAWWEKGWMERHTYFLPRYDGSGRMLSEGHALAAAPGVGCLLRRTYKHPTEPAPDGDYDFVTYFECADADVPTFHEVCAALRDPARNPEWAFVREGPTWHGRRVATWPELFT